MVSFLKMLFLHPTVRRLHGTCVLLALQKACFLLTGALQDQQKIAKEKERKRRCRKAAELVLYTNTGNGDSSGDKGTPLGFLVIILKLQCGFQKHWCSDFREQSELAEWGWGEGWETQEASGQHRQPDGMGDMGLESR